MYNFAKNRGGFGLNFKRDTDRTECNFRLEISLMTIAIPNGWIPFLLPFTDTDDESQGTVPVPVM